MSRTPLSVEDRPMLPGSYTDYCSHGDCQNQTRPYQHWARCRECGEATCKVHSAPGTFEEADAENEYDSVLCIYCQEED